MDRIELAHEPVFRIGLLTVRPGLRQLARDDGTEEIVEPRVMQVLVALARANGGILSRDDLTTACWEGRVVGEDAINRVISRLRRAAEGIGEGTFRIETVTKVGYRLIREGEVQPAPSDPASPRRFDRRTVITTGASMAVGSAAAFALWYAKPRPTQPDEVATLTNQARVALRQGTIDGTFQAIGLLRRAVQLRPGDADAWGMLAIAYGGAAGGAERTLTESYRERARSAAQRALALDPANGNALVASIQLRGRRGNWLAMERDLRAALTKAPGHVALESGLVSVLVSVGRGREAADIAMRWPRDPSPTPGELVSRARVLWLAGRLEEAEQWLDEAFALFPTHFGVWFVRFFVLMYSGRAAEALAFGRKLDGRPTGIGARSFDLVMIAAQAMDTRAPRDVDAAMRLNLAAAHDGAGYAENAMQFAAALGRLDTAFDIANAYYFARGFQVGDLRFTHEQGTYSRIEGRGTHFLFLPSTAAMRADARFDGLTEELGLARYWRESGTLPDYRHA